MATQTVTFSYQTGKTLTLKLYALSADTIAATASVTERSNQLGVYAAVFTDVTPGTYRAVVFLGSVPVYSGFVNLAATTATFEVDGLTAIGTAFLSTALTKGTAGTIERAFWQMLKTQAVTDGTAVADAGNTLTQFQTNLTAPDGQYDHMILVFVSNGLEGEARPIDTYVQANGVITLQESLTEIPTGDEEFIILPQHSHPISEIQAGLATSAQVTALDAIIGSGAGPHAIDISVADGLGDVANATCVLKSGTLAKAQGISDASGDLTLYAEDGTYTLITYSDGHVTKSQTVVLDGDDVSVDVTLSAVGVSVPDSPRIRARLLVLDKTTKEGKSGVELQITVTDAAFADGYASEANTITVTSDANGLAEWYALPGESYKITGENVSSTVTVPKTATDPHSVKSVLV